MKILIVDDDIATVDMIDKICDWKSLDVTRIIKAYDGNEAELMIQSEHPDIVLCDIGMPKVNGIEVLKWIRENKIECEFVFLTCYSDFEYAREAVHYGAVDYLTKPFDPQELYACMRKVAARVKEKEFPETDERNKKYKTEQFLYSLADGVYGNDEKEIREVLKTVQPDIKSDTQTRIICIRIDCREAVSRGWKKSLFKSALEHIFVEMLTDNLDAQISMKVPFHRNSL